MSSSRIAIIGIDAVTASIGLALQARESSTEVVGYDENAAAADLARARGAIDVVRRDPGLACEEAKLVIVAQPLTAMESSFEELAPRLGDGAVVTDTAGLKTPVLRWAKERLPQAVSFVGGHVVPNPRVVGLEPLGGVDDASEDLLSEALYCLTPGSGASSSAIDICSWLAQVVGAYPFFIDALEHDGLLAGIEGLPDLLTVALVRATIDTPGWQEMRKVAGHRFATATEAIDDVCDRGASLFLNRENVLHRLDALVQELLHLRRLLSQEEREELEEALAEAAEVRSRWMEERQKGMWAAQGGSGTRQVPGMTGQLGSMLFGGLASRFGRKPGESEEA